MVRLLPVHKIRKNASKMFQSHNGAIAAQHDCGIGDDGGKFQSHNGAIAARRKEQGSSCSSSVSIPQWCDCCQISTTPYYAQWSATVSIPQWCDCCIKRKNPAPVWERFQSHNGAIAAGQGLDAQVGQQSFNPTMVRLLLMSIIRSVCSLFCFNPTMVRLLLII